MKIATAALCLISVLVPAAWAQATPDAPKLDAATPNRVQLEATLQNYLAAYQQKNYQRLLEVWPSLSDQKKEADKIRRHLEDNNISQEQVTIQPLQTESTGDMAVMHAERTEQYLKLERSSSIAHGDLNMGNMPVQDPGPSQTETKKPVKKTDTVWIKFHKSGDNWAIVSITSQKPQ